MEQKRMTPEQLEALRGQLSSGEPVQQQAPQQVQPQQVQPQQPQQAQQRLTPQQLMMQRMQESKNKAPSGAQVLSQGEQYQPVNQTAPAQQTFPVANQTIINTTQQPNGGQQNSTEAGGESDGGKGKGFKMNPIMAVAIVIAVLLFAFFIVSYLGKNKEDGDSTEDMQLTDPFSDPNVEWVIPDQQFSYEPDQVAQLRAAGYTGDEIEQYASQMTPYTDLIRQAEAARDAYIQDAIAPLYDTASDEYKHFISQTWLALDKRSDIYDWKITAMNYSKRENLDYEKVDVYGNQLFIKIYLDDNVHADWFYCLVTPEEWNKLNDSGNIIVNYTYTTRVVGDDPMTSYEDTENFYIISSSIEFVE